MNEPKEHKEKKHHIESKLSPRRNIWKIVAISVIALFALFIVWGSVKAHRFMPDFVNPTQEQADYAKKVATDSLQASGEDISSFEAKVWERMPRHRGDAGERNILQVSLYNNSTTHTYLVDVDSGKIIMHSKTEIFEKLGGQRPGPGPIDSRVVREIPR